MPESLSSALHESRAERISDHELMAQFARIWADPELRRKLRGSALFIRERLMHFGHRGFLTARERQGIFRTLYTGAVPLYNRLRAYEANELDFHLDETYKLDLEEEQAFDAEEQDEWDLDGEFP